MFKRSDRAKMLAVVAALGIGSANLNTKAMDGMFTFIGSALAGAVGAICLVKFTDFGKRLVGVGNVSLSSYSKLAKANRANCLKINLCQGNDIGGVDFCFFSDNGKSIRFKVNEEIVKKLENNKNLKGEDLENALKKWNVINQDSAGSIQCEFRKLSDVKAPEGVNLKEVVVFSDGKGGLKWKFNGGNLLHSDKNSKNVGEKQKEIDAYIESIQKGLEKNPIVQAIKESENAFNGSLVNNNNNLADEFTIFSNND